MDSRDLLRDAVLRVGEVTAVEGRKIFILVDQKKNLSEMFLDGEILTNIAVNSYVEIRKGFLNIIGRVEGERIQSNAQEEAYESQATNQYRRILTVVLTGYIDERGVFNGGTRELPLIGNEAYLLTRQKIHLLHNLVYDDAISINIATLFGDDVDIQFPVDGLFNSHIAIFGNTGSGKTNTLAALYRTLIAKLHQRNPTRFAACTKFLFFDFNGEYGANECITPNKTVYNLSTRGNDGDKLPFSVDDLLEIEALSVLVDATEKTQKPFLRRSLRLLKQVFAADNSNSYFQKILKSRASETLQLADKVRATLLIDYFGQVLPEEYDENGLEIPLAADLEWYNAGNEFRFKDQSAYLRQQPDRIPEAILHKRAAQFALSDNLLDNLVSSLYVQLISDVLANRAQNEHVAPMINRLKAKKDEIEKLFSFTGHSQLWSTNVVIVNLHDVNLEMKKTIPLLLAKRVYAEQKQDGQGKVLSIIIDEAHNVLSKESSREAETWKDYRLETFEEIIKEGRKFGVFITLASQRPSDISPTIASQAHNYFVHRLVNQLDLKMISTAVSYIDRVTEESIPTLPTGTCVFSGVATQVPLKINIKRLAPSSQPQSLTRRFSEVVPAEPTGPE